MSRMALLKRFALNTPILILLLFCSGCVSQQPLPYAVVPRSTVATGPVLAVLPMEDRRVTKDTMDKLLKIPECVEVVLANELEGAGLFQSVASTGAPGPNGYTLRTALEDLRWEVPSYDQKVAAALGISIATGGLGGLIYGSTDTDVLGHAALAVVLSSGESVLLDKRYVGTVKEERAKLNCDTATTRREMAAKAVADAIRQFKEDLRGILSSREGRTVAQRNLPLN